MNKTVRVSEARLNDFCYILLKKLYFEPALGTGPRQCDIRICMDMSVPEQRIKSAAQAVLLPNERAGSSHETMYDVDLEEVYDQTVAYIVDHWRAEFPEGAIEENKRMWLEDIVPQMMEIPEDQCGPDPVH